MKQIYQTNDLVEYYVRVRGKRYHRIGFVKSFKRGWLSAKYYICATGGEHHIDIVRAKQIFGKLEKIEKPEKPEREYHKYNKERKNYRQS